MQVNLHLKALELVKTYKRCENDLLDVLQAIDRERIYLSLGCSSLFRYCVEKLQLSESETYRFIQVARKSVEVPALKEAIAAGTLTVSKASRVAPVISSSTEEFWIQAASTKTHREIEREITRERPREGVKERLRVLTPERSELRLSVTAKTERRLKRAQEVYRTRSYEETLEALLDDALPRRDPLERAQRSAERRKRAAEMPQIEEIGRTAEAGRTGENGATGPGTESNEPSVRGVSALSENSNSRLPNKSPTTAVKAVKPATCGVGSGAKSEIPFPKYNRNRVAIPASVRHAVYLRDRGRCTYPNCGETRWTEIHHVKFVARGGGNNLENLLTLCAGHHRGMHLSSSSGFF